MNPFKRKTAAITTSEILAQVSWNLVNRKDVKLTSDEKSKIGDIVNAVIADKIPEQAYDYEQHLQRLMLDDMCEILQEFIADVDAILA